MSHLKSSIKHNFLSRFLVSQMHHLYLHNNNLASSDISCSPKNSVLVRLRKICREFQTSVSFGMWLHKFGKPWCIRSLIYFQYRKTLIKSRAHPSLFFQMFIRLEFSIACSQLSQCKSFKNYV